jgi:hypothetical protein
VGAASSTGCGREFFREWADQDVSEAVFEKSRDPRFRLDFFSVEPPAMARFADPTDPDRPPAPPDDYATQALATAPQWPNVRLLTPMEGTGYIDMMEAWLAERRQTSQEVPNLPPGARGVTTPADTPDTTTPPPAGTNPSPAQPDVNSGPTGPATSPIPSRDVVPPAAALPNSGPGNVPPPATTRVNLSQRKDSGVQLAAFQAPDVPQQPAVPVPAPALDERKRLQLPANVDPSTGLNRETFRSVGEQELAWVNAIKVDVNAFDEAEAAGLPPKGKVYILNPPQVLQLSLINNRAYHWHLENLYVQALPVAAARFNLAPQFVAGLFPQTTPTAGGLGSNPVDSFTYANRSAPGGQRSGLNIGTAAGMGKVFSYGGKLVTSFANSTVFNFLSKNSAQPNVSSLMPLTFVQPFLQGGGRAVTLEPLTQAERTLIYECRNFARFRQEWIPFVFGFVQAVDNEVPNDPNIGYLNVIQQLQDIENDQQTLASFQRFFTLYKGSLGGGSGISQLQVDQMEQQVMNTVQTLIGDEIQYRNVLEQFKQQLGLPPDVPIVLDRGMFLPIRRVFFEIEAWSKLDDKVRDNEDLAKFIEHMPKLKDMVIDGRPVIEYFAKPELREDVLLAAERVALENRLDLMNQRAVLYDLWRQYAVNANALKGVFTLTITNTFSTPSTTTNPMGFLDQSRNFQMVMSTELPLIRMTQRNQYRQGIINYRRGQRLLMSQEDSLKYSIRSQIRNLVVQGQTWDIQKRVFLLTLRQRDNAQRQINAPPGSGGADTSALVTANTTNVINAQNQLLAAQTRLITTWVNYETQRMALYRDLGIMPYDEWEAFYEFFPPEQFITAGGGNAVTHAGAAAARPADRDNVATAERR